MVLMKKGCVLQLKSAPTDEDNKVIIIGISGPDRVLFTIAREYFKADTYEKAQGITNRNEDRNGLFCCPKEKPCPRNPIQNGTFILLTPIPF